MRARVGLRCADSARPSRPPLLLVVVGAAAAAAAAACSLLSHRQISLMSSAAARPSHRSAAHSTSLPACDAHRFALLQIAPLLRRAPLPTRARIAHNHRASGLSSTLSSRATRSPLAVAVSVRSPRELSNLNPYPAHTRTLDTRRPERSPRASGTNTRHSTRRAAPQQSIRARARANSASGAAYSVDFNQWPAGGPRSN